MTMSSTPLKDAGEIARILDAAADLIEPEGAWGQGQWESSTGCLCAEGALAKAGACERFVDVCRAPVGRFFEPLVGGDIVAWNDAPGRTQAEVVAKLREAAAKARAEAGL